MTVTDTSIKTNGKEVTDMAATVKAPSKEQMETLYRIAIMVVKKFKVDSENWKDTRPAVLAVIGVMAIGLVGTMGYYIIAHRIGPLMVYVALATIVLAFGLNELSRKLQSVVKEFTTYHTAMSKMLATLLRAGQYDPSDLVIAISAAVLTLTNDETPDDVTFRRMKDDPSYLSALEFAKMLAGSAGAIDILTKQGLNVQELIGDISYAYSDEEYDEFMANASYILTNITGHRDSQNVETTVENSWPEPDQPVEEPEPEPETTYHQTKDDSDEDLSIRV